MSFFDDALKDAVPGGDLATPIAIAAGALLLHHFMGGQSSQPAPPPASAPAPQPGTGSFLDGGGLLGGLSGLVSKLTNSGVSGPVNSWVGQGPNLPVDPSHLGTALGPDVLSQLSARTGLTSQQLVEQLAQVLPRLVNNLTPNGRLPTGAEAQYGRPTLRASPHLAAMA
jgi:uncharacterized protein YidB (DUF937 family)